MSQSLSPSLPSIVLRDWVQAFNDQVQLGLEVNEDHLTLFESEEGDAIAVQALDEASLILVSSDLVSLPADEASQLRLLKTVALANYRGLVTGPAKISLHPEGELFFLELPLLSPQHYSVDDFAEKLNAFMLQLKSIKQGLSDGSLESQLATSSGTSEASAPEAEGMLRI